MKKKTILIVVGTRPNLVKISQFQEVSKKFKDLDIKILHTGQHYDEKMSDVFLKQFNIKVDFYLNISQTSPNSLIGEIVLKLEDVINKLNPDLLLCVGDVNSTLAASISANKMNIKLGHIESGLRSLDREMPEEINRIITDELSDLCFVTEDSGIENLKKIGKSNSQIAFVGNTMIDTLIYFDEKIEASNILEEISVEKSNYILMTMHRPRNVDNENALLKILDLLIELNEKYEVVFAMHPRTKNSFERHGLYGELEKMEKLKIVPPQNYFSFQKLTKYSFCVITDSGGIQEETTFQKIPCITLRENTERPITITHGTNTLMSFENKKILSLLNRIEKNTYKKAIVPKFWDGRATERILKKCESFLVNIKKK